MCSSPHCLPARGSRKKIETRQQLPDIKEETNHGNRNDRNRYVCYDRHRRGIGIGIATGKASEAIARQPEASGKINSALLLGCALAEGTAIFGFITALLILFMG